MALTEASAALRLVQWEILCCTAPERILTSSSRASWPLGLEYGSKTPPLPCFGHLDARKHRTCRALATQALERAARGPARCPRGARMGRSSPHLVPPKRAKGLLGSPLDAPRALEGAARAPAQCPEGALRGCSSLLSVPGCSKCLFKLLVCTTGALRAAFQAPVPERSMKRSTMLLEGFVLGYI